MYHDIHVQWENIEVCLVTLIKAKSGFGREENFFIKMLSMFHHEKKHF